MRKHLGQYLAHRRQSLNIFILAAVMTELELSATMSAGGAPQTVVCFASTWQSLSSFKCIYTSLSTGSEFVLLKGHDMS